MAEGKALWDISIHAFTNGDAERMTVRELKTDFNPRHYKWRQTYTYDPTKIKEFQSTPLQMAAYVKKKAVFVALTSIHAIINGDLRHKQYSDCFINFNPRHYKWRRNR